MNERFRFSKESIRTRERQNGVTAIEFAIVAPVLFLLLMGLAEMSLLIYVKAKVMRSVELGAREIRTLKVGPSDNRPTTGNQMTARDFTKDVICQKFADKDECVSRISVDVRNDDTFAALRDKLPASLKDVGPNAPGAAFTGEFKPGGPGKMGSLIVTYDWQLFTPGLTFMFANVPGMEGISRLTAISVYRNEM